MNDRHNTPFTELEQRLRRAAPPCAPAHADRVARVCAAVDTLPPPCAHHSAHPAFRMLARRVAALALLVLTAVLAIRLATRQPPQLSLPLLSATTLLDRLSTLHVPQRMTGPLAAESENLLTDLVTLTTVVNERTLDILF